MKIIFIVDQNMSFIKHMSFINSILFLSFIFLSLVGTEKTGWARGGGGGNVSLGLGLILATPSQDDINTYIDSVGSAGTKNMGSGYEFYGHYSYRFSGSMFALHFQPSYFSQSSSGGGLEAKLSGITFFPILRLYPLENSFIKFFLQAGVGYARLSGTISNAATEGNVGFTGSAFGALAGLGSEFCFSSNHCLSIQGNLRYLPIERNLIDSGGGQSLGGNIGTNNGNGTELEFGTPGQDLKTTLSGIMGVIGYSYYF